MGFKYCIKINIGPNTSDLEKLYTLSESPKYLFFLTLCMAGELVMQCHIFVATRMKDFLRHLVDVKFKYIL